MISRGASVVICVKNVRIVSRSAHRSDDTDARKEARRRFVQSERSAQQLVQQELDRYRETSPFKRL
jgi:hypothetical protein